LHLQVIYHDVLTEYLQIHDVKFKCDHILLLIACKIKAGKPLSTALRDTFPGFKILSSSIKFFNSISFLLSAVIHSKRVDSRRVKSSCSLLRTAIRSKRSFSRCFKSSCFLLRTPTCSERSCSRCFKSSPSLLRTAIRSKRSFSRCFKPSHSPLNKSTRFVSSASR
jgi:hypothetical protein